MLQLLLPCLFFITTTSSAGLPISEDLYSRCSPTQTTGSEVTTTTVRSKLECTVLCSSSDRCRVDNLFTTTTTNDDDDDANNDNDDDHANNDNDDDDANNDNDDDANNDNDDDDANNDNDDHANNDNDDANNNDNHANNNDNDDHANNNDVNDNDNDGADCTEAYDLGHRKNDYQILMIQPITSPAAFSVRCRLQWGGVTYPIKRSVSTSVPWIDVTWNQIKSGFSTSTSDDFFIGLDKVHQILSQAKYQLQVFSMYNVWGSQAQAYYENFTLGPDSSGYELRYDSFAWLYNQADNGLDGVLPKKFCTKDHGGCMCGKWGWLGSDCKGFDLLRDPPLWPVGGSLRELNGFEFCLVRTAPYI
ncbi:hypothetical protein ACOMHN_033435 [Nucella lapillus]